VKLSKVWRANLLLLLTAIIWGFAFVPQRLGANAVGPLTYNALRFGLASLVMLLAYPLIRRLEPAGPSAWKPVIVASCLAGVVLFAGSFFQTAGLLYTGAGKAGFITGLYVVLVPLIGLFWKQRTGLATWLGALLAVAGLYLLSVTDDFRILPGDLLVMVGALCWAFHVQALGYFSRRVDPLRLALGQFIVNAILSSVAALLFERNDYASLLSSVVPVLYGGLLSVGVAYTLQVIAQKDTHPAHAALIMVLEAVFAVLAGWLLLGELFGARELLGCGLMLAGMLLSQLGPFFKFAALSGPPVPALPEE
jgi:drug/metabolite transporter (DMT)-like permease